MGQLGQRVHKHICLEETEMLEGPGGIAMGAAVGVFFIFIFFKIVFKKIYFRFHNLQVYTLTVRQGAAGGLLPVCGAAGPLPPLCRVVGAYM